MGIAIIIVYAAALTFILLYSLVQLHLVVKYVRFRNHRVRHGEREKEETREAEFAAQPEYPFVTVQLPLYNELYVVERLIEAIADFDYPKDRFEIQVLDDSTDESVEIAANKIAEVRARGIQIEHVRRPDRVGFKAGALDYGMQSAKGDFIAIFDADFLPPPNFLKRTLPHFEDPKTGVVQTRWEHINKDYSLLTKMQAFALDAHFSVEQQGRNAGGYFINFNGTAGVWRKECIEDAGGWEHDTLTEDLDLSYRAQLKGWQFRFLEHQESPAELPATMSAIKSQQFRWTKGAAEVARKNLRKVLVAKLPFGTKVHALFHLLNSALFICILLTAILSVPLLFLKQGDAEITKFFDIASIFLASFLALVAFFWTSRKNREPKRTFGGFLRFAGTFPVFLGVSMGFSLHNALATVEGYIGRKSPFIRTPKFNIKDLKDKWNANKYISRKIGWLTILEGLLALYFLGGLAYGIYAEDYGLLPFHALLVFGYGTIFYFSVRHALGAAARA